VGAKHALIVGKRWKKLREMAGLLFWVQFDARRGYQSGGVRGGEEGREGGEAEREIEREEEGEEVRGGEGTGQVKASGRKGEPRDASRAIISVEEATGKD